MKSSTLHRSNLTKERMSMLENIKFQGKRPSVVPSQFVRVNKTPELDVLYRSLGKNTLKKSVAAGGVSANGKIKPENLGIYLGIGAIGGTIFLLIVSIVVWISSLLTKRVDNPQKAKSKAALEVVSESKESENTSKQEKYVIKSGDTLDKIAYRFYGKYDVQKIEEIKKINNIKNPEGLQIGQVLTIPVDR